MEKPIFGVTPLWDGEKKTPTGYCRGIWKADALGLSAEKDEAEGEQLPPPGDQDSGAGACGDGPQCG